MLDAEGRALVISEFFRSGRSDRERQLIVESRSSTLAFGANTDCAASAFRTG